MRWSSTRRQILASRPRAVMENSAAIVARIFRNNPKASAAASNAGPRLAEVAGSTSSRGEVARFFFAVLIRRDFVSLPTHPRRYAELANHLACGSDADHRSR